MKLKCEFTYKCELEATKEEIKIIKGKYAEKERFLENLSSEVNNFFLADDGRTEVGMVTDFKIEVEDEK